jgi:hypothetical protein
LETPGIFVTLSLAASTFGGIFSQRDDKYFGTWMKVKQSPLLISRRGPKPLRLD